jgi:predicted nucleic acid-binding protein
MPSRVFVDTNVLVYAEDAAAGAKRTRARELIEALTISGQLVLSTQVLQELFSTTTRKLGVAAEVARTLVERYSMLDVVVVHPELILDAIDLHRLHTISFWDALVIRSASAAACGVLLSEDLQHGRTIDGVRIENPFLPAIRSAEPRARYKTRTSRRSARV